MFEGKTIFVAKGLGKEIAVIVAERGANVILLARSEINLHTASLAVSGSRRCSNQLVETIPVDLKDPAAEDKALWSSGHIPDVLFCVAGGAQNENGFLVDLTAEQVTSCMENNYYTSVFIAQSCLRLWLETRRAGGPRLVFVSSTAALVGAPGYEVLMYGGPEEFQIHCALPGTFMSETFVAGLKTKPELTKRMEGVDDRLENLVKKIPSSRTMAEAILKGLEKGSFMITTDLTSRALLNNMRGPSPRDNVLWDSLLGFIAPWIWVIFRVWADKLARAYGQSRSTAETFAKREDVSTMNAILEEHTVAEEASSD
ncbi:hypothetical protein VTN77DRAFT_5991 [Rasamsonia byssochlamydoides]|uniref:uncharacterized protein n=1 Tax=Rasamsonia byssochlamydoides TaxID=89139 RepID=UPI003743A9A3